MMLSSSIPFPMPASGSLSFLDYLVGPQIANMLTMNGMGNPFDPAYGLALLNAGIPGMTPGFPPTGYPFPPVGMIPPDMTTHYLQNWLGGLSPYALQGPGMDNALAAILMAQNHLGLVGLPGSIPIFS